MIKLITITSIALILTACSGETAQSVLSENELRTEIAKCNNIRSPSNFKGMACQNFQKECEKRVKKDDRRRDCTIPDWS
ncbi:MAG: hypothetical protein COC19_06950 [SAR86 cluster bacterium]|uniref:Entry exclusion lipoprotein TrbK n=1 Tax=SAR86 cluster bacterium TaxID=2030880 RepID=A0A2A4MI71_9GAMM|nr:MAG: hypothetical protein COC19_06950 [SAR86 cluster bacterium]